MKANEDNKNQPLVSRIKPYLLAADIYYFRMQSLKLKQTDNSNGITTSFNNKRST